MSVKKLYSDEFFGGASLFLNNIISLGGKAELITIIGNDYRKNFINSTNNKLFGYKKIVGNYKNVQESIDLIQSRLEDFKIVNLVSRIIRHDIYYSYKNKNYFLNIISTCNEYKPKRSCDDENDQLRNMINNLIFTTK